jgi:hypothetical protein
MVKLTNAQLIARVALLESEVLALKDQNKVLKDSAEKLLKENVELKAGPSGKPLSTIVKVDESEHASTIQWVMKYVGLNPNLPSNLLNGFDIYTNQDKSWLALYPKKGVVGTNALIKAINSARFNRNITGNLWRNDGVWMNIPVKK